MSVDLQNKLKQEPPVGIPLLVLLKQFVKFILNGILFLLLLFTLIIVWPLMFGEARKHPFHSPHCCGEEDNKTFEHIHPVHPAFR